MNEDIVLGNGAIALGAIEAGCEIVTGYPGTPSSEIIPEIVKLAKRFGRQPYVEWSTNEKVALDTAFAACLTGKRALCCMKMVGLNVAADSLMSSAYLGTIGGLVIVSCDDPGPQSSQTEQDTRLIARAAKVPVLDPSDPQEAREMVRYGFALSEEFQVPVILRPTTRVCHARQSISYGEIQHDFRRALFKKNAQRWAATPMYRLVQHGELNRKLKRIAEKFDEAAPSNIHNMEGDEVYPFGIITGGVPYAVVQDLLFEEGRQQEIPVLKLGAPYPFPERLAVAFLNRCEKVLVIEDTDTLIEVALRDRRKVYGRLSGHVPEQGELVPEVIHQVMSNVLSEMGLRPLREDTSWEAVEIVKRLDLPVRKPNLCPGCPHRAAFFAIKRMNPKAIFTSDIGCYTLGVNMGAVDTILDMGATITMAAGFYHAFAQDGLQQPIVSTIGDSTFFHSGPAGLINAVYNRARFILVILDNLTTAMTGMQPTPALGIRADGSEGGRISLEQVVTGCGVTCLETVDPYNLQEMKSALRRAKAHVTDPQGGIAAIIARRPCLIAYREEGDVRRFRVTDACEDCSYCIEHFGCPALIRDEEAGCATIDDGLCSGCGVCVEVCPKKAILEI